MNYIFKPVANSVLILEATANELIQFSPFNEMNGVVQMQTMYVSRYRDYNTDNITEIQINHFTIIFKAKPVLR